MSKHHRCFTCPISTLRVLKIIYRFKLFLVHFKFQIPKIVLVFFTNFLNSLTLNFSLNILISLFIDHFSNSILWSLWLEIIRNRWWELSLYRGTLKFHSLSSVTCHCIPSRRWTQIFQIKPWSFLSDGCEWSRRWFFLFFLELIFDLFLNLAQFFLE